MSASFSLLRHCTWALGLVAAAIPLAAGADGLAVTTVWESGSPVTITGEKLLGDEPELAQVCLAPEAAPDRRRCYYDAELETAAWDDRALTFLPPADAPPRGIVTIRRWIERESCSYTECQLVGAAEEDRVGVYTARGSVLGVVDVATGLPALQLLTGRTYRIGGELFGEYTGTLYVRFPRHSQTVGQEDIIAWTPISITFRAPDGAEAADGVSVNNGGLSVIYSFADGSEPVAPEPSPASSSSGRRFFDLTDATPHAAAIRWLADRGILGGYDDGTFKPLNTVNRAELLTVLARAQGLSEGAGGCFTDVADDWFAPGVCAGARLGWVNGYGDGSFRPGATVNRVEAIKMVANSLRYVLPDPAPELPYADVSADDWFAPYVAAAWEHGLIDGTERLDGHEGMRRGEVAELLYRALSTESD